MIPTQVQAGTDAFHGPLIRSISFLIIALGAQVGLLSSFSEPKSDHDKKNFAGTGFSFAPKPMVPTELASSDKRVVARNDENQTVVAPQYAEKKARVVEKSKSEKVVDVKREGVKWEGEEQQKSGVAAAAAWDCRKLCSHPYFHMAQEYPT